MERQGRLDEAEATYRHAANTGDTTAQRHLGRFLEKQDRLDEAEATYRRAANTGDTSVRRQLERLMEQQGGKNGGPIPPGEPVAT